MRDDAKAKFAPGQHFSGIAGKGRLRYLASGPSRRQQKILLILYRPSIDPYRPSIDPYRPYQNIDLSTISAIMTDRADIFSILYIFSLFAVLLFTIYISILLFIIFYIY
jgi:hypothetical protein